MTEREAGIPTPAAHDGGSGRTLRRRILFGAGIGIVVVLGGLAWAGTAGVGSVFHREAELRVRDAAQRSAVFVDRMLTERQRELDMLLTSPTAIDAAREGTRRTASMGLEREPVQALEQRFNGNRSLDVDPRLRRYLGDLNSSVGAIEAIVTDQWGHNIVTTSMTQDFMQGDESWWQTAAEIGHTPAEAEFDDWSKQVVMTMAGAIREPSTQRTIGVMKLTFNLSRTDSALARSGGTSGGIRVELIDGDGIVISSSSDTPRMRPFAGARVAAASADTVVHYTADNRENMLASIPVGGGKWRVVAHVDDATALVEARRIQRYLNIATVGLALALLIGLAWLDRFVASRITHPTERLAIAAERVAAGDLSVDVDDVATTDDEIGRLTRATGTMIRELRRLATALRSTSSETAAMAEEITSGAGAMATTAEAMALTSSDLSEQSGAMSQAISQFSNDATRLVAISSELDAGSQEGLERNVSLRELATANRARLDESASALETLSADVAASATAADSLAQASEEIRAFVTFVQKMARQSKLLALNAAMEAARAGVHGQGFAVVAGEVRRLATEAAENAERTETLVRDVLARVGDSRATTARTVEAVASVSTATREGLDTFSRIEAAVVENEEWMRAISSASTETHALIDEMTRRLESVSKTTESFAASMEEVAASSEEQSASTAEIADVARSLARSADELSRLVSAFRLGDVAAPPAGLPGVPSVAAAVEEEELVGR
ncbi:MAG: methyl-accepting chemotaxis protein [Gemmatimonadaceae bacterium]|nr:methyl-accepting chemotaxis protein [Gemmatimonadaceae bacterium]NUQ92311.1 methyl-accepting chemotaxis protein [Gemmatimonadaceae bacterium]NUR19714.1 methyl-accepting chemotaxis protein [Gemmatimonadaceae bacterium]